MDETLKGVVGIQNMGNTCYCNSIIQLVRACDEWNLFCSTEDFSQLADNNYKKILVAYQVIINSMWSSYKPSFVRPIGFLSELKQAVKGTPYEMFGIRIPNDSHEFLIYLLDHFHEAIKTEIPCIDEKNGWDKFVSKNNSKIVDLFFGMIRKTIHCMHCKNNTYQWEVFNSFKIPCEGNTFYDWIQNEIKDSEIEGYKCENCKESCPAKILSRIWKLPRNLFIMIRRFNPNRTKNMTKCPYDGTDCEFSSLFAEESNDPSRNWVYSLRGISDHHGSHMGGHYNTQFKHPVSNEWWIIDDESSNKQSPQFSSSNYIFLFTKI